MTRPWDESRDEDGRPRPEYEAFLQSLEGEDLRALGLAATRALRDAGVTFGPGEEAGTFPMDPVPRILEAEEWDRVSAGLAQRVRALNAFVLDAYHERRIVADGVVPEYVVTQAEGYEPELEGRLPTGVPPIGVAGLDLVRGPDGELRVLEDNCRTPSGIAYVAAVRRATHAVLPRPLPALREVMWDGAEALSTVIREAAPGRAPRVVVLTDGPENHAYWEHAQLARGVGGALLTCRDLERVGDELRIRGGPRVDVLYRRCDEDRLRDAHGEHTVVGDLVTEPWLTGRLGLVNAFGTGLADDKLVHAYVEEMVRFYLGEEPVLRSVPTLDCADASQRDTVLDDLGAYVVKPRGGYGGNGVVICRDADAETLAAVRRDLAERPGDHIAQRVVELSCHPTVVGESLEPRHIDLRPFVFASASRTHVLAGGLTRYAADAGVLVVNSSQDGGGKDTWVLR